VRFSFWHFMPFSFWHFVPFSVWLRFFGQLQTSYRGQDSAWTTFEVASIYGRQIPNSLAEQPKGCCVTQTMSSGKGRRPASSRFLERRENRCSGETSPEGHTASPLP
jgi:hypothetical protein